MRYTSISFKVYSCLVSTIKMSLQTTISNITYGYSIIGDKIVKYIFDSYAKKPKGCFVEENFDINLTTTNDTIANICKTSKLKIIDLWHYGQEGSNTLVQKFALDGPFKANLLN